MIIWMLVRLLKCSLAIRMIWFIWGRLAWGMWRRLKVIWRLPCIFRRVRCLILMLIRPLRLIWIRLLNRPPSASKNLWNWGKRKILTGVTIDLYRVFSLINVKLSYVQKINNHLVDCWNSSRLAFDFYLSGINSSKFKISC